MAPEIRTFVALSTQCRLLKVTRSVIYERKKRLLKETDEGELVLLRLLDEEYTRHLFYGSRRIKGNGLMCQHFLGHTVKLRTRLWKNLIGQSGRSIDFCNECFYTANSGSDNFTGELSRYIVSHFRGELALEIALHLDWVFVIFFVIGLVIAKRRQTAWLLKE